MKECEGRVGARSDEPGERKHSLLKSAVEEIVIWDTAFYIGLWLYDSGGVFGVPPACGRADFSDEYCPAWFGPTLGRSQNVAGNYPSLPSMSSHVHGGSGGSFRRGEGEVG